MAGLKYKLSSKRAKHSSKHTHHSLAYDVVCVGRPAKDTLLSGKIFNPVCSHGVCYEHIPLGSKIPVDNLNSFYGGNAFNSSVTFARQNLNVALLTQLGEDSSSKEILDIMNQENISDELIYVDHSVKIPQSTIVVSTDGERSILAYPGADVEASRLLSILEQVETRWIYISSINSLELLEGIIRFAEINQIKLAFNPGGLELENIEFVKPLLKNIEVLILNRQEASLFFGSLDSAGLAKAGAEHSNVCIVTDGPNGSFAHDGKVDYIEPISEEVEVVDRTGAGDAFASGLVAGLAWGLNLKDSLRLASSNSTSVVQHIGAQEGILRRT